MGIHYAVRSAEWPVGSGSFSIFPESGKGSGRGNGVVPIKLKPMQVLSKDGWTLEHTLDRLEPTEAIAARESRPGDLDAAKRYPEGLVVVEWETGNVSSSHRAINKMALALVQRQCIAGVLVVPNKSLARYLTDRIGNVEELRPYFPMWRAIRVVEGVLELIVIEHDQESTQVPKIPKGGDGRAREGAARLLTERNSLVKPS